MMQMAAWAKKTFAAKFALKRARRRSQCAWREWVPADRGKLMYFFMNASSSPEFAMANYRAIHTLS
jgi:hypothetical protein